MGPVTYDHNLHMLPLAHPCRTMSASFMLSRLPRVGPATRSRRLPLSLTYSTGALSSRNSPWDVSLMGLTGGFRMLSVVPTHRYPSLKAMALLSMLSAFPPHASAQPMQSLKGAAPVAEGRDFIVVNRVRFLDRMGFDRPIEAFSVLLPKGWKHEGGVQWGSVQGCRGELVRPAMKASSADGSVRMEMFPAQSFSSTDDPMMLQALQAGAQSGGCKVNRPFSSEQFVEGFARRDLGARVTNVRPDEGRRPMMQRLDDQSNATARQYGQNSQQRTTLSFGDLTFPDGTEGLLHAVVVNVTQRQPNYVGGGSTTFSSTMATAVLIRFPAGRRQEGTGLLAMIMASHRMNPTWQEAQSRFLTQLGNMEHAASMERIRLMGEQSRAYAEAQNVASEQRMRSWERRQESQDRQHKSFVQAIREVETWRDSNGSVELTAGYERAWSRGDGSYLLTNKPGFDPAAAFKDAQWRPMQREQ